MITASAQTKVTHVDLKRYSGKWYVIATIPTGFDKDWNYTTENYNEPKGGKIEIFTTYKKGDNPETKSVKSKGFPIEQSGNVNWKVQFIWPFKSAYLIEELADDYTYVVVGHPKKKFLYIMNRSGKMAEIQYEEIKTRFANKGYDVSKIRKLDQGL